MENNEKGYFVAIPNKMFAFDTNYFVTNDELEVYYQIYFHVSARNPRLTLTNIEFLNSVIEFDKKNPSRGKKRIQDALLGLHDKGYINITFSDSKLRNTTYLEISLPELDDPIFTETVVSGSWGYKGFTEATHDMFLRTKNTEQLKVVIYVSWRSFSKSKERIEYKITYKEWESVLNVSHATAIKIIDSCVNDGLIVKHTGDYYETLDGKPRQEPNRYEIKEEKEEKPIDVVKAANVGLHYDKLSETSKEKRKHNWFTQNSKLNEEDMYVYLRTECNVLREHAQKRINGISKTENGKELIDSLLSKAQKRIKNENREKELTEKRDMEKKAELMEEWDREWKYVKKKDSSDISYFLSDEDDKPKTEEEFWREFIESDI